MRCAFVVIDMQKEFLGESKTHTPPLPEVVEQINYVAGMFRNKSMPVIFVQDEESLSKGNTQGFDLIDSIEKKPSDEVVRKIHGNSFRDTPLLELLKKNQTEFVVFAGYRAEGCVLATVKGAENLDVRHAVLRNGIISTSSDGAAFVEKISPIVSWQIVPELLR